MHDDRSGAADVTKTKGARMLKIWLFGSLVVANDASGEHTPIALSGRCASLLAYLALGHGRYFSRSELLNTVWPERSASMTAGSFNTALWRLRRVIEGPPLKPGDLIATDRRGAIGLNGPVGVWLDVGEFEQLVTPALAKPLERLGDEDVQNLKRGIALYKSDILLEVLDDWALREREKHRRTYLNALWRLMELATVRREYGDAIGYAQAIIDSDALREDVHRELMQLFVLNGQRAQALRQFEHCRDLLKRELAIQPMRETLEVYQRIADSAIGATEEQPSLRMVVRPHNVPHPPRAGDAQDLVQEARRNLALADTQLQLTLQIIER